MKIGRRLDAVACICICRSERIILIGNVTTAVNVAAALGNAAQRLFHFEMPPSCGAGMKVAGAGKLGGPSCACALQALIYIWTW